MINYIALLSLWTLQWYSIVKMSVVVEAKTEALQASIKPKTV